MSSILLIAAVACAVFVCLVQQEGEDVNGKRKRIGKQERKELLKKAKAAERREVEYKEER